MTIGHTAARILTTGLAQGLSSFTNFGAGALALHAADGDVAAFGRFAIVYQLAQVVITVTQNSIGASVIVHGARDDHDARRFRASGLHTAIAFGLGVGLILGASALVFDDEYRTLLLLCAMGSPALAVQYTLRSSLFARDLPRRVIAVDGVWFGVLVTFGVLDATGTVDVSVAGYLAVWLGGAYASALLAAPELTPSRDGSRHHFGSVAGSQTLRLAVESLLGRSVFVVTLVSAELLVDAEAAGSIAAAILVMSPLSVVHTSATAVAVPTLVRARGIHVPQPPVGLAISGAVAAATLGWILVVVILDRTGLGFGPFALEANGVTLGIFVGVAMWFLAMALSRGAAVMLRVADRARETLNVRIIGSALEIVLPAVGFAIAGTALGAQFLGLASALAAGAAWIAYARVRATDLAFGEARP